MKRRKHTTQFCPVCGTSMRFVEDKGSPHNRLGYLQICDKCCLHLPVDETGINPANSSAQTIKFQALLQQKFPGLMIELTKTELVITPLPNLMDIANEGTVCFVWLINQFRKTPSLERTQFDIAKDSGINIGTVRTTLSTMQQADLLKKANKAWQFNKEVAIKLPKKIPPFKSTRGGRTVLDISQG